MEKERKDPIVIGLEKLVDTFVRRSISPEKFRARERDIEKAKEALIKALADLGHVTECAAGG